MKFIWILAFTTIWFASFAQQNELGGQVLDEHQEAIYGATVMVLHPKDSTMCKFALTDERGLFRIKGLKKGDYILQISYVSFQDHISNFMIHDEKKDLSLPKINLSESVEELQEVLVTADHIPMGMKGDTISYNAAAFITKANASVEDLLRKLPGIEVDRNGDIKAQGEKVEDVLVDGKSFFGSNPQMATKNLEAQAIDKVEVFDKKSEASEFTGLEDSNEKKTINLKLKDDYKKGSFGKAKVAGGQNERFDSKLNYFKFSPKFQSALIFSGNNINKENFSLNDRIEFLGGLSNAISNGVLFSNPQSLDRGINTTMSSGLNFNFTINDKMDWRSHYILNHQKNQLDELNESRNQTSIFNFKDLNDLHSNGKDFDHLFQSRFEVRMNPASELIFKTNLEYGTNGLEQIINSAYYRNDQKVSTGFSNVKSLQNDFNAKAQLIYRKKFKQKDRSLILNGSYTLNQIEQDENFENILIQNASQQSLVQEQTYVNNVDLFKLKTTFTEPLKKKTFLSMTHFYENQLENPSRQYFDASRAELERLLDLGGSIERFNLNHGISPTFKYVGKKLKVDVGINAFRNSYSISSEELLYGEEGYYFLPNIQGDLKLKRNLSLKFNYNKNLLFPTLKEVIAFPENGVANLLFIGNPLLKSSIQDEFRLNLNFFDGFSLTNLFLNTSYSTHQRKPVQAFSFDDNAFQTIELINAREYNEWSIFFNFSTPINPLNLKFQIRHTFLASSYSTLLNRNLSEVNETQQIVKFTLNNKNTEKFYLEGGMVFNWSQRKFSASFDLNQNFTNQSFYIDSEVYLIKNFILGCKYDRRNFVGDSINGFNSINLIALSVSRFLLDKKLEIYFSVNDLLNQNNGYLRSTNINSFYESNYNDLGRYFLAGVQYNIGKRKKDDKIQIESN